MATVYNIGKEIKNKSQCLYNISKRNRRAIKINGVTKRRVKRKTFKFLDEFIPSSKKYLSPEHMKHLIGMTEVEDPIPPQMPKRLPKKIIQKYTPQNVQYQQTFPEFSILSPSEPRFVELVKLFNNICFCFLHKETVHTICIYISTYTHKSSISI